MLESLLSRRPLLLVLIKQIRDEVLGNVRYVGPHWVLKRELTKLDFLDDFLVVCAIERRKAGE